jgi:ubiquinone/menaquinone biosynthesis C-methylase UbiE
MGFAQFFRTVQDAPWYRKFLDPVLDELRPLSNKAQILDVGTGPGKFIELVHAELPIGCVGVDIDETMLEQARQRPSLDGVSLIHIDSAKPLPFDDASFEAVCFCSVLFLLDSAVMLKSLQEAQRILKAKGKIIVLTPTGSGNLMNTLNVYLQMGNYISNQSFFVWRRNTSSRARHWQQENSLSDFAEQAQLQYRHYPIFKGMASIEILEK